MDDFQAVNASIPIFFFFSLARRLNWNHAKFISVTIYMCLFTAIDSWPLATLISFLNHIINLNSWIETREHKHTD